MKAKRSAFTPVLVVSTKNISAYVARFMINTSSLTKGRDELITLVDSYVMRTN